MKGREKRVLEVRPKGFFSRRYEIVIDGEEAGHSQRGFWGNVEIDLQTGDALLIKRRGFLFAGYELVLRGSKRVVGTAEGRGFLRRCYDVEIGDSGGTIEPSSLMSRRRDYSVDGRVVAVADWRGFFSRGFVVTADADVPEIELLFFGWITYLIRLQQSSSSS